MMFPMILAALENDEDRALMEELYLRHHRLMYAQALRVLNDSHAAEDAVSSALEALIRKIPLLRDMDGNKRKAYIVITVRHAAIDIYRRHSRETVTEDEFLEQIPSDSRVEDRLLESAGVEEIRDAIRRLGDRDRDILMMRYFREMSDREIGRELELRPTAVRVRISRARKHLVMLLQGREAER